MLVVCHMLNYFFGIISISDLSIIIGTHSLLKDLIKSAALKYDNEVNVFDQFHLLNPNVKIEELSICADSTLVRVSLLLLLFVHIHYQVSVSRVIDGDNHWSILSGSKFFSHMIKLFKFFNILFMGRVQWVVDLWIMHDGVMLEKSVHIIKIHFWLHQIIMLTIWIFPIPDE